MNLNFGWEPLGMKISAGSIPVTDPQFGGYVVEFRSQVDFLKDLARMSWVDSPTSEKGSQDEKMRNLGTVLDKIADDALDRLSYENFKTPNASLTEALVKMAIFLYLNDKLKEFYRESEDMNKDGVYALFDTVRDWTANFLTSAYFSRPASENIKQYIMVESQFVAIGELTGVDVLRIQDVASSYQKEVFEKLLEHLKKVKAASAKPPAPGAEKPKPEPAQKEPEAGKASKETKAKKPRKKRQARKKSKKA